MDQIKTYENKYRMGTWLPMSDAIKQLVDQHQNPLDAMGEVIDMLHSHLSQRLKDEPEWLPMQQIFFDVERALDRLETPDE